MSRNFVAALMSIALACLAVAFVVIAVISDAGPTWAWIVLAATAVAVAAALLRVGILTTDSR
jgi:NADH:ubiquinone oxidoreductase subunit K